MVEHSNPSSDHIPVDSVVFGFGPMLPFAASAVGAWILPAPWPPVVVRLAVIWGSLILAFVAGVRRGFGFGNPEASKTTEIVVSLLYFVPAGLALVATCTGLDAASLCLLTVGYMLVMILDPIAARAGNAPRHFARLRGPQMAMAVLSLLVLLTAVTVRLPQQ